jgi:hypothetical protein
MTQALSPDVAPIALLFLVIATAIMWLSARIVGVRSVSLFRSFVATIGVSLIVGAVVTAMSALGTVIAIGIGLAGLIGCVWIIRQSFQISAFPAFLIFVVNVMVQVILISLYLRPFLNQPPVK